MKSKTLSHDSQLSTTLLKKAKHSYMNHLQLISFINNLETNETDLNISYFQLTRNRINTILLLFQKHFWTPELEDSYPLHDYLRELVLPASISRKDSFIKTNLKLELESHFVSFEKAVVLGLFVNEFYFLSKEMISSDDGVELDVRVSLSLDNLLLRLRFSSRCDRFSKSLVAHKDFRFLELLLESQEGVMEYNFIDGIDCYCEIKL